MKTNPTRTADRVFRRFTLAVCVLLLDANLILLSLPLIDMILVQFGARRADATDLAMETPFITVPALLLANILLIVALRHRQVSHRPAEDSPNLNKIVDAPANIVVGVS